ncbi:MAG TPA: DinB family protein [Nocardioidaceae bacterium]|nr:DinB family protein [Nocardioidaceae bacterium]
MPDFTDADLRGSRFERVDLTDAHFQAVDLSRATIRNADLVDVDITGYLHNVRVNGVDIGPLIEMELDRMHPERLKLRPTTADGYREAWDVIEAMWPPTVDRARRLPPDLLHERVDGEWSFIETMRHLVFATDAWVRRAYLGEPSPYDALDLPHTEMGDVPGVPNDASARPSLDEVLALRADRVAGVRQVMVELTDDRVSQTTEPVDAPGYPAPDRYAVIRCLNAAINEEWWHHQYAVRDLAVLEARV